MQKSLQKIAIKEIRQQFTIATQNLNISKFFTDSRVLQELSSFLECLAKEFAKIHIDKSYIIQEFTIAKIFKMWATKILQKKKVFFWSFCKNEHFFVWCVKKFAKNGNKKN